MFHRSEAAARLQKVAPREPLDKHRPVLPSPKDLPRTYDQIRARVLEEMNKIKK